MTQTVFTPKDVAARWKCSERHIRNMIESGLLPALRIGPKLLRIEREAVEEYECQNGGSRGSKASSASLGTSQEESADVIDLEQQTRKRRPAAPRLDSQSSLARSGRQ